MLTPLLRYLKLLVLTVFSGFFIALAVVNRSPVELSLFPLPYTMHIPAFLLIVVCFSLGLITGWVLLSVRLAKKHLKLKSEHKRVAALQNELGVLKTQATSLPAPAES